MRRNQAERFGDIKGKNLRKLYGMIKDSPGISRAQLSRESGLSKPAISDFVDELASRGIVKMTGLDAAMHPGRKAVRLEVNSDFGVFISVSLNKSTAVCRIFDFSLNMIGETSYPVRYVHGAADRLLKSINNDFPYLRDSNVAGCIFTVPAALDSRRSEIMSTAIDIEPGMNLVSEIESASPYDTLVIMSETTAYCYAEYTEGNSSAEDMIFVEISEGVGAGIVISGKIFRGAGGSAGEFGHICVDRNGLECKCGRRGCLEKYISVESILERAVEKGVIRSKEEGLAGIRDGFSAGNAGASHIYEDVSEKLSFGLGNMIAMFDISSIVIGGGIEALGEDFLDMVRKKTDKEIIFRDYRTVKSLEIEYSKLDRYSNCLGAVRYYCDNNLSLTPDRCRRIYYI